MGLPSSLVVIRPTRKSCTSFGILTYPPTPVRSLISTAQWSNIFQPISSQLEWYSLVFAWSIIVDLVLVGVSWVICFTSLDSNENHFTLAILCTVVLILACILFMFVGSLLFMRLLKTSIRPMLSKKCSGVVISQKLHVLGISSLFNITITIDPPNFCLADIVFLETVNQESLFVFGNPVPQRLADREAPPKPHPYKASRVVPDNSSKRVALQDSPSEVPLPIPARRTISPAPPRAAFPSVEDAKAHLARTLQSDPLVKEALAMVLLGATPTLDSRLSLHTSEGGEDRNTTPTNPPLLPMTHSHVQIESPSPPEQNLYSSSSRSFQGSPPAPALTPTHAPNAHVRSGRSTSRRAHNEALLAIMGLSAISKSASSSSRNNAVPTPALSAIIHASAPQPVPHCLGRSPPHDPTMPPSDDLIPPKRVKRNSAMDLARQQKHSTSAAKQQWALEEQQIVARLSEYYASGATTPEDDLHALEAAALAL